MHGVRCGGVRIPHIALICSNKTDQFRYETKSELYDHLSMLLRVEFQRWYNEPHLSYKDGSLNRGK